MNLILFLIFILQTLATWLRYSNDTIWKAVDDQLHIMGQTLFTSISVEDILWGYRSDALNSLNIYLEQFFDIQLFNDTNFGLEYQVR